MKRKVLKTIITATAIAILGLIAGCGGGGGSTVANTTGSTLTGSGQ